MSPAVNPVSKAGRAAVAAICRRLRKLYGPVEWPEQGPVLDDAGIARCWICAGKDAAGCWPGCLDSI